MEHINFTELYKLHWAALTVSYVGVGHIGVSDTYLADPMDINVILNMLLCCKGGLSKKQLLDIQSCEISLYLLVSDKAAGEDRDHTNPVRSLYTC